MINSSKLQRIAEIVMVLGILALCQPWSMFLHRYGVAIILVGLITFMLTNWFGKTDAQRQEEMDGVFDVSDHQDGRAHGGRS
jgi:disulfide bond formation protein DsbB